jgi:hypothetical protein
MAGSGVQMRIASQPYICICFDYRLSAFAGFNFSAKNFDHLKKDFLFTIVFQQYYVSQAAWRFCFSAVPLYAFLSTMQKRWKPVRPCFAYV